MDEESNNAIALSFLQCFSADTWLAEGHLYIKSLVPLIPIGSFLDQLEEEEDPRQNRPTQVHLEKRPLT